MPGMKGHVPYHGDGFPTPFEPHKHFVNLRKRKWRLAIDLSIILALAIAITYKVLQIGLSSTNEDKIYIVILVILWIFTVILITGILKLNKFRKGFDVDISYEDHKQVENTSDES